MNNQSVWKCYKRDVNKSVFLWFRSFTRGSAKRKPSVNTPLNEDHLLDKRPQGILLIRFVQQWMKTHQKVVFTTAESQLQRRRCVQSGWWFASARSLLRFSPTGMWLQGIKRCSENTRMCRVRTPVVLFYLESNEVQYRSGEKKKNGTLRAGYAWRSTSYTSHMCSDATLILSFLSSTPLCLQDSRTHAIKED